MSFKYVAGYNCLPSSCDEPPHIEVVATDGKDTIATLYTSPPLSNYSYDQYKGYSPLQLVDVDGLRVANSKSVFLALRMVNGKHNLQLQVDPHKGFDVTVHWSADKGPEPPTPPSPWLQTPTNGLGVTRGPLVFALHPSENKKVVATYDQFEPARPLAVDYEIGTNDTWNYGILPEDFTFVNKSSAEWNFSYPFVDNGEYPFYITAKGRSIASWGYWSGSQITDVPPASPVDCTEASCGEEAELRLVPFGLTNIRISVFPWIHNHGAEKVAYV